MSKNCIENCLIFSLPMSSFRLRKLFGFFRSFLPVETGDSLQKAPFKHLQKRVKKRSKFPWLSLPTAMTFTYIHIIHTFSYVVFLAEEWNSLAPPPGSTAVTRKKVVLFNVIFEEALIIFVNNEGKMEHHFGKLYNV